MLSIVLTFAAYFAVVEHIFENQVLVLAIMALALAQFFVQLFFFLHLGKEEKPRWNAVTLFSTISIILIVVVGSLWIMYHLDYNMTPDEMNAYILEDEGMSK